MEIDRRTVLLGLLANGLFRAEPTQAGGAPGLSQDLDAERLLFAAARRLPDGRFEGAVFDSTGVDVANVPLPSRGHDVAVRPRTGECVVFARRPGTFAIAFNRPDGLLSLPFATAPERHFYGHGVFSPDGRLLFTTENDYVTERGMIGVRDASNGYRLLGEFASHGIGPHDLAMLSDGRTLVVANGGILTHPEEGRRMLNLASMQPNLVYLDARNGDLLERHSLSDDLHKLSIRHLSVTPDDDVVLGCQFVGPKSQVPSLVATHRRQQPIRQIPAPARTYGRLRNYVSSIDTDRTGRFAVATSAKGSAALLIDLERRAVLRNISLSDVSGVARGLADGGFVLTNGEGALVGVPGVEGQLQPFAVGAFAWDNHLTVLSPPQVPVNGSLLRRYLAPR